MIQTPTRRGFLGVASALFLAPAIVRAESIMQIAPQRLVLYGDGINDDAPALRALMMGGRVINRSSALLGKGSITGGSLFLGTTLILPNVEFNFNGTHLACAASPVFQSEDYDGGPFTPIPAKWINTEA